MFQREWYRLQGEGKMSEVDMGTVPDIYLRNQQLASQLKNMQVSIDQMKEISDKAKGTWDKFRKERDFHKMHHKRVVQVRSPPAPPAPSHRHRPSALRLTRPHAARPSAPPRRRTSWWST